MPESRLQSVGGFTLLEITVAMVILSLTLAGISVAFVSYRSSLSARRAAQIFGQDLSVARSYAVRTREAVSVVFEEATPGYLIVSATGDTLVSRTFTGDSEVRLDTLDLDATGDSIQLDSRGRIDFSGITGSVGVARFITGDARYQVRFNLLGTARVSPL